MTQLRTQRLSLELLPRFSESMKVQLLGVLGGCQVEFTWRDIGTGFSNPPVRFCHQLLIITHFIAAHNPSWNFQLTFICLCCTVLFY